MPQYYSIPIYEDPDAPAGQRKVIGAAIFDSSSGSGPYGQFIGLISGYDARDYNFDGSVSLWETIVSNLIPGNYAETRFTYQAFTQLMIETGDPFFHDARISVLNPYMVQLQEWGIEKAYGIPPPHAHDIADYFGDALISSIVEHSVSGYVAQFFLKTGFEYLYDEIFLNAFIPTPPSSSNLDIFYIGAQNTLISGNGNFVVIPYSGSASITSNATGGSFYGTPGDDLLNFTNGGVHAETGEGNDGITANAAFDYLDGGAGNDTLTLDFSAALVEGTTPLSSISLGANGHFQYFYGSTSRETDFVNFESFNITGTAGYDVLYGSSASNHLIGLGGNDTLSGGASTDILDGGDGADAFQYVGLGDTVDGGSGTDKIYFDVSAATGGLTINLLTGQGAGASWTGIEYASGILGSGNDSFTASAAFDYLDGGAGNDTLTLDFSTALVEGSTPLSSISLSPNGHFQYFYSSTSRETDFANFENLNITGTAGFDVLYGGSASSHLIGLGSNDTLFGGAGTDILDGGEGNDYLSGSDGLDTASYASSTASVNVDLSVAGPQVTGQGTDTLADIENLVGSRFDDDLAGNAVTNQLFGGLGNDTYIVEGQVDLIFEDFGEGTDSIESSASFYLYANVENLVLTGSDNSFGIGNELDNSIIGNVGANLIISHGGDDVVNGGGGADSLFGLDGADTLAGDAGIDFLAGGLGNDILRGGADADALYGEDGDDYLDGGTSFHTDILVGGAGNDTLYGISGQANPDYDLMDGGSGDDIYYVDTGADLTFEAAGGGIDSVHANVPVANAGVYLYANVENLILEGTTAFGVGNELDNQLTGSASGNWLLGGSGNDRIEGKGGNDVLFGEGGSDTFVFGAGSGQDVIGDFSVAQDKIQFGVAFTSFAQVQANSSQVGADMAINLGDGNFIVLLGVNKASLTAANFVFAPAAEAPAAAKAGAFAHPAPFDPSAGSGGADSEVWAQHLHGSMALY